MTHHSHTQQCACNVRADFDIIIGARTTSLSSLESLLPTQARRWCVLSALRRAQERAAARNFGPSTLAAQLTAVLAAVLSFFYAFCIPFPHFCHSFLVFGGALRLIIGCAAGPAAGRSAGCVAVSCSRVRLPSWLLASNWTMAAFHDGACTLPFPCDGKLYSCPLFSSCYTSVQVFLLALF